MSNTRDLVIESPRFGEKCPFICTACEVGQAASAKVGMLSAFKHTHSAQDRGPAWSTALPKEPGDTETSPTAQGKGGRCGTAVPPHHCHSSPRQWSSQG